MTHSTKTLVAVAVAGPKNLTRISRMALPLTEKVLEQFARLVARKEPDRIYYIVAVDEATWGTRKKEVLYQWHVGEGFEHKDGWWVEAGE